MQFVYIATVMDNDESHERASVFKFCILIVVFELLHKESLIVDLLVWMSFTLDNSIDAHWIDCDTRAAELESIEYWANKFYGRYCIINV